MGVVLWMIEPAILRVLTPTPNPPPVKGREYRGVVLYEDNVFMHCSGFRYRCIQATLATPPYSGIFKIGA